MPKHEEFTVPYLAACNLPYMVVDQRTAGGDSGGGVLAKGQAVWLPNERDGVTKEQPITAYVENLGMVLIDARFLIDFTQHLSATLLGRFEDKQDSKASPIYQG